MNCDYQWIIICIIIINCQSPCYQDHQKTNSSVQPVFYSESQTDMNKQNPDDINLRSKMVFDANNPCPDECHCDWSPNPYSHGQSFITVDCSNMDLYHIPQDMSHSVEVLLLDRNHLAPEELDNLPDMCNLIMIDLSHNNLYQLKPFEATCLHDLEILIITHNTLEYIADETFMILSNLRILNLADNTIEIIKDGAFMGLIQLVKLELSRNRIFCVNPNWFQDLKSLHTLNLNYNTIHFIGSKVFRYLDNLKLLDLSNNKIQHIYQQAFYGLSRLNKLLLDSNDIIAVPSESLRIFSSIDLIDMSNNHLKYLGSSNFDQVNVSHLKLNGMRDLLLIDKEAFINCLLLEELELNNNRKLVYIDRNSFSCLKHLSKLSLTNNALIGLDREIKDSLPLLRTLSLAGNPWSCDCRLEWIQSLTTYQSTDLIVRDIQSTKCSGPLSKVGCVISAISNCDNNSSQSFNRTSINSVQSNISSTAQKDALQEYSNTCAPRVIGIFDAHIGVYIGEEIQLDCRALGGGDSESMIGWILPHSDTVDYPILLKPGQSLSNDNRVSVTLHGSLHIEYVTYDDVGNYTCRAINSYGQNEASCEIRLKAVLTHIIVLRVTDISITVTWKSDPNAHDYQILYQEIKDNSTYHKVKILPYMKYYTLNGLSPRTDYKVCISLKHKEKSLLINCSHATTLQSGYTHAAVQDARGFIIGGTTACLVSIVLLMCVGSHVIQTYNRNRRSRYNEGTLGDDSDMFLAGLDSVSEMSPMTYENRFALMFDDSDIEEIQISAAEASAALGLRSSTNVDA